MKAVTQDHSTAGLDRAAGMGGVTQWEAVTLGKEGVECRRRWGGLQTNFVLSVTVFHLGNDT